VVSPSSQTDLIDKEHDLQCFKVDDEVVRVAMLPELYIHFALHPGLPGVAAFYRSFGNATQIKRITGSSRRSKACRQLMKLGSLCG
jgi:hypothetical protein